MLKAGSAVDATLIAAPSATKNGSGTRDPEVQPTQKGRNWYFGMKRTWVWTLSQAWFTRSSARQIMYTTSMLPKRGCTVKKQMFMLTPDITASNNASKRARLDGMLRCGPASEDS